MRTSLKAICAVSLCLLSVPATAEAQTTQADSLRSFVETLLTGFMYAEGKPTLRLANLPKNVPELRLTPGARVVGSLEYSNLSMSLIRADAPAELVRQIRAALESVGWSYKAREVSAGFSITPAATSALLCADSAFISVGASHDQHVFVLHSTNPMLRGQCIEPARSPDGRIRGPLPRLDPPAGAMSMGNGSSGGGRSWSFSTRLNSDLSLSQIRDHYVKAISLAGGEFGTRHGMESASTVQFTFKDPEGVTWQGMMAVIAISARIRNVYIELNR